MQWRNWGPNSVIIYNNDPVFNNIITGTKILSPRARSELSPPDRQQVRICSQIVGLMNKFEKTGREEAVAYGDVLSQHFPEETKKTHIILQSQATVMPY
jgi:hypothetical protein